LLRSKDCLAFKSKELEKIYIPDIISTLKRESNPQLDDALTLFVGIRLGDKGLNSLEPESKDAIRTYLDAVRYRYDHTNKKETDIHMSAYGKWLEASALAHPRGQV